MRHRLIYAVHDLHYISNRKHCANYRADFEAIMYAITFIAESQKYCSHMANFTEALSVLKALRNSKLPKLSWAISQPSQCCDLVYIWIPVNCCVPGSENADKLAKFGAKSNQPLNNLRQRMVTMYNLLSRAEYCTHVRLRSGLIRLNAYMHNMKMSKSPKCSCTTKKSDIKAHTTSVPTFRTAPKRSVQHAAHLSKNYMGMLMTVHTMKRLLVVSGRYSIKTAISLIVSGSYSMNTAKLCTCSFLQRQH